ncbi:BTAD domain-containing putative transcriptional regulator [Actinoplanes sp. TFC3]|uniref:AfsR/SARP family transcriptional regulator n=1 Tax=Actinoplanes sp. TFC3 TaxID=1710355 RepID=UPI00083514D7|nr:BTAD domain-containing putative transcriptional regulator [Actinoplanes sp. TFC3]
MADDIVRLLGPVRIRRNGVDQQLGSGIRAALLAVLALAGEATREQLIAAVWGDDPPPSANGNVYTHISALREALGEQILTREDGVYRLHVSEQTVDTRWFEALRAKARRYRADDRSSSELDALEQALSLWNGEALAGLPGPYADAHRVRLRELRTASEHRRDELLLKQRDIVRAVAFLGPGATLQEVSHVTGLPVTVVEQASDWITTTSTGTVTLSDPALGEALYGRTPQTLRSARHEFFAHLIADSFGPPERVATQLLRAAPAPLSVPASRWLLEHIDELAHRSPRDAVDLLRRAHLQHLPDPEVHVALSIWLARLLFGQGRDAAAEAGWAAARTGDPDVQAEMLWIAACSHDRRNHPVAAAEIARSVLGRGQHGRRWLGRFRHLILHLRVRLPGTATEPRHDRAQVARAKHRSAYRAARATSGPR